MNLTSRGLIIVLVSLISISMFAGIFIFNREDLNSNNTELDNAISIMGLSEAVEADYIVYYTTLVYVEENDESYIPGAFPKDDWALSTQPTCFGTMTRNCYWVPINTEIVEKDRLKRLELALEENSSVESVDVSEENGRFLIDIKEMIIVGDSSTGEVESVIKTIELYTDNYDVYYQGEKGFDKFYDTAFPKGG